MAKRFNLYIRTGIRGRTFNILDINDGELNKIIELYNLGRDSLFIKGRKYSFRGLNEIQIFTFNHPHIKTAKQLINFCRERDLFFRPTYSPFEWLPQEVLQGFGERITDELLLGDFGFLKESQVTKQELYVEYKRIEEINSISSNNFDFTKLVAMLLELNSAYVNQQILTIPLIVRAVIDHIPPLFGLNNFNEVCNNYGTKSFRENMNNLNKSSRKIADSFLHTPIRNKESLPTKTQVNFKNDLDVLLQEIVRINK
jgi:hypothetical protein